MLQPATNEPAILSLCMILMILEHILCVLPTIPPPPRQLTLLPAIQPLPQQPYTYIPPPYHHRSLPQYTPKATSPLSTSECRMVQDDARQDKKLVGVLDASCGFREDQAPSFQLLQLTRCHWCYNE